MNAVLHFGPFTLDAADARLRGDGRDIVLAPRAFAVLCHLVANAGRLVTKNDLLDAVWGHRFVSESALKTAINTIRDGLGDDARQPRYIETVPRHGYRFIATVRAARDEAVAAVAPPRTAVPVPDQAAIDQVERHDELGRLRRHLGEAAAGHLRIVLLAGEAGIGKSTLIDRFAHLASSDADTVVAIGQCVEHHGDVEPYLPLLEALNRLCGEPFDPPLVSLMRQVAPTWLVQLPWHLTGEDRQQLQREVAGATQDRMLREFGELMQRCCAQRPVVLVLEDLHWSDGASVQLIGYLARRRMDTRLMLLASFRPADVIVSEHPLRALRQALRLQRLCDEIALEAFAESEVADYLARRFDQAVFDEAFVRRLHDHTGGVPLYVAAVTDALVGRRTIAESPATGGPRWRLAEGGDQPLGIPDSLAGVLAQQKERLSPADQQRLAAASVVGQTFTHLAVADVLDADPDVLQRAFDALAAGHGWLRDAGASVLPDGRIGVCYAFRHALYRQALYELTPVATRIRLHRAMARMLQATFAEDLERIAAELASHFERGQDPANAVIHLVVAARNALRRFAAHEALASAQRASRLLDRLADGAVLAPQALEAAVIESAALMQLHGVASPSARAAHDRVLPLIDRAPGSPARVPALQGLWWSAIAAGELGRARALAQQAIDLSGTQNDPMLRLAGHAALGVTLVHVGELQPATHHLSCALEVLRSVGVRLPAGVYATEPEVQLQSYLALTAWWRGHPGESAARRADALALAERIGHPMSMLLALHVAAMLHLAERDHERARNISERALDIAAEYRLARGAGAHTWARGCALAGLGEVDAGLAMMRDGMAVQTAAGLRYGLTWGHQAYAQACLDAGRESEAEEAVTAGLALAMSSSERTMVPELLRLHARIAAGHQRHDDARRTLRQALRLAGQQGALYHEIGVLTDLSAVPGVGRAPARRLLARRLRQWTDPRTPPFVAQARGLLER